MDHEDVVFVVVNGAGRRSGCCCNIDHKDGVSCCNNIGHKDGVVGETVVGAL